MGLTDRQIAENDRCSTCQGSGWTWWSAEEQPAEGKWVVCRMCIGTGRVDQKGRKRQKPTQAPSG